MKTDKLSEKNPFRVLIVDDESLARLRIRELLEEKDNFEIVGECSDGTEAIKAIEKGHIDLLFLDVQMPDLDGFEVLTKVKSKELPTTIFVTAFDKYALKAFEFHAVDYLLKPFDDERFEEMLAHAQKQIRKNRIENLSEQIALDVNKKVAELLSDYKNPSEASNAEKATDSYQKRLVIKSAGKISFVEVEDVDWIGAEGSYVSVNLKDKTHLMRETLKNLEKTLDPQKFLRIHRSTIVNIDRIKEVYSHFRGEFIIILKNGKQLKLSRKYRKNAEKLLRGQI